MFFFRFTAFDASILGKHTYILGATGFSKSICTRHTDKQISLLLVSENVKSFFEV